MNLKKTIVRIFFFGILLGILMFIIGILFHLSKSTLFMALFISYIIFGYDVLWRAIKNIKKGQIFDENFLMSISTIGAIFLGEMAEAVFVMLFYHYYSKCIRVIYKSTLQVWSNF